MKKSLFAHRLSIHDGLLMMSGASCRACLTRPLPSPGSSLMIPYKDWHRCESYLVVLIPSDSTLRVEPKMKMAFQVQTGRPSENLYYKHRTPPPVSGFGGKMKPWPFERAWAPWVRLLTCSVAEFMTAQYTSQSREEHLVQWCSMFFDTPPDQGIQIHLRMEEFGSLRWKCESASKQVRLDHVEAFWDILKETDVSFEIICTRTLGDCWGHWCVAGCHTSGRRVCMRGIEH